MTTSGVTAWSLTGNDHVKAALNELGVLSLGSDPDAEESDACLLRLNAMLKSWQQRGVTLFREASVDIVTTPATASKALPAGVRSIASARLIVSATSERKLWPWSRSEYLSLPNKAPPGSPTIYYLDRQRDAATIYFWPVSATAVTVRLDYDRIVETVTLGTETLDIREELQETVYANLAVRCAGVFGEAPNPELVERARMLEALMFDAERPDFYRFETEHDYA